MHHSEHQHLAASCCPCEHDGNPSPARFRLLWLAALIALSTVGCSTDTSMTNPVLNAGNLFKHPTESGFRAMARASCGTMSIGDSTVSGLMAGDEGFNAMVSALYQGDISNDEFMNQVLEAHPADDANVPATGCIMDQLAECFAEACEVQTPSEQAAMASKNTEVADEIADEVTIDPVELPSKDRPEVDQMIETSKREGPQPLP